MGNPVGFLTYSRETSPERNVAARINDYNEIYEKTDSGLLVKQASRCMSCGIPFCHSGCPLGNLIPDFNDAVYKNDWKTAYIILAETNNFPEFTGRICPAPCESSCVLGINQSPVTIENIEKHIIEHAFACSWVSGGTGNKRSGKKIAIIGSGPAGLAASDQLNQAGHQVIVYEKNEKPGGLLRYGIPDFKLEKWVVDRRIKIMEEAGITFICNANIGIQTDVKDLMNENDALLLCGGSSVPRDIPIEGRDAKGVYFAMDFLEQSNKYVDNGKKEIPSIYVEGKKVVVIGGGDTGADCVGTSNRQGAASITQIEFLSKPGLSRTTSDPWPMWPMTLRTSSSHDEGCAREWSIHSKKFIKDEKGRLAGIEIVNIEWVLDKNTNKYNFIEIEGSTRILECDVVFIAAGFLYPQKQGMIEHLGLSLDQRGNIATSGFQTNIPKVFSAGDMRRGQSLVVWAIHEGREAARAIDQYLMGASVLPGKQVNSLEIQ